MPQKIRNEATYWNEFYEYSFTNLQDNETVMKEFNNHLLPDLNVRFSAGNVKRGRILIEQEFAENIKYETRYRTISIYNLKDIGIIQGENINSPDHPHRCPPTSTLIFHRQTDKTFLLQFHNASKRIESFSQQDIH